MSKYIWEQLTWIMGMEETKEYCTKSLDYLKSVKAWTTKWAHEKILWDNKNIQYAKEQWKKGRPLMINYLGTQLTTQSSNHTAWLCTASQWTQVNAM